MLSYERVFQLRAQNSSVMRAQSQSSVSFWSISKVNVFSRVPSWAISNTCDCKTQFLCRLFAFLRLSYHEWNLYGSSCMNMKWQPYFNSTSFLWEKPLRDEEHDEEVTKEGSLTMTAFERSISYLVSRWWFQQKLLLQAIIKSSASLERRGHD